MAELKLSEIVFLVDTREQMPWDFSFLKVPQKTATLKTADYSIEGYPEVVVERKSLDDLLGVCGNGRERFEAELQRMLSTDIRFGAVVVETSWDNLNKGFWRSKISPRQIKGSVLGWSQWGIPFFFEANRQLAAETCARFLYIGARRIKRERESESRNERHETGNRIETAEKDSGSLQAPDGAQN